MSKSSSLLSLVCFVFVFSVLLEQPTNANAQKKSIAKSITLQKSKNPKTSNVKSKTKSAKNDKAVVDRNDKNKNRSGKAEGKKNDAKKTDSKSVAVNSKKEKAEKNSKAEKKDRRKMTAAERAAARRAEEERRRQAAIEAARREAERRAAIEVARRREQARREAIARQRAFENGLRTETEANIAADDVSGEDLEVRRAAINALGKRAGSVVVMDAQNGQIVSIVNQKWAIGQGYKPCSTIKLVTGAAGLTEGVINQFGSVNFKSHRFDLTDALAFSNNSYFQSVGGTVGFQKMASYAHELGLGAPTGINAPNESSGKVPDFKTGYAVNHMSSHGDDFETTPLQLATMVSAITNGGKLITPQVARTKQEADALRVKVRRTINVPKTTLQSLVHGMIGAVNYGTARRANDPSLNIGGKTGSCIGQGSWLGLFASVAPVSNPKYAVVVVTRGQSERGKWAAAVAGQVYQALAPKIRALQPLLANTPQLAAPQPKVDPRTAAALSEESDEAENETENNADAQVAQPTDLSDQKRLVKPTVSVVPVNPPIDMTPRTKKGEYTPRPQILGAPPNQPAKPKTTLTIQSRPRVVNP